MSTTVVLGQMIMIFFMILIGVFLYKGGRLSNDTSKQLSWIIVNITNPITLLCAALKEEQKISAKELATSFALFAIMYAVLIAFSYLIPRLLFISREKRFEFRMLTIFGNVGFIGIPFASAVLGSASLIYVAICGLCFNLIFYTYGMRVLAEKHSGACKGAGRTGAGVRYGGIVNAGTVMSVATIIVYAADFKIPGVVSTLLTHIGSCTTFMSMLVLGVSVAQMIPRKVFSNWRLYVFIMLRQIDVPIMLAFIMKAIGIRGLMLQTIVILSAMPAANLPLMACKQFGIEEENISAGIIFTTLAAIVTIPLVVMWM
ncbi:AEC family transporter [Butyrivibrio sp. INlla21]|uniref:AEC family transporter n=1 Tax=Butyrivibrio sp. INlla21 TaxID=1520811 RepID=UPI0008E51963|nr:AEC family transporter [Butyrivibrio sp. INlla21]SFU86237.1 Predicted permease [Butyrivibrio sp. INlla21]